MNRPLPPAPDVMRRDAALLIDFDGTLVDFAPTPDAVSVTPALRTLLSDLEQCVGGAMAIVTGRALTDIDSMLAPLSVPVAAEHGGVMRVGADIWRPELPDVPAGWRDAAARLAAAHPGALVEAKPRGFVLHVRRVPAALNSVRAALQRLVSADARFELLDAAMAIEVRPRGADKGTAVLQLMSRPPFAGRAPVFVGDDVTDEDGMRAARALGGCGLRVADVFGSPAGVRAWLNEIVRADAAAA